jgi:uncharacterized protein (TIRG00374 family)
MIPKRNWFLWLLIIAFVWLVISRFTEIKGLAETLSQGQWQWVLAAIFLTVILYLVRAWMYQAAFYTVEVPSRIRDLLPLVFASIFVSVAVPSAGASGAVLFVDDASRRGQSQGRTAAGVLMYLISDLIAFTLILIVGLAYLFLQHDLQVYQIIAALLLLAIILTLTSVLLLGLLLPDHLLGLLSGLQRSANRFAGTLKQKSFLPEDWAVHMAGEFTEAATAITAQPRRLARTLVIALSAQLVQLCCLLVLFQAFRQHVVLGTLVAGYAVGVLFWIVSITPQGIGVVEGVITLVYTSLGVPAEKAALVALSFRGLTFWLPFGIGFLSLRRIKSFQKEQAHHLNERDALAVMTLASLASVAGIYSEITQALPRWLPGISEFLTGLGLRHGGYLTAALGGFTVFILAGDLLRRKGS